MVFCLRILDSPTLDTNIVKIIISQRNRNHTRLTEWSILEQQVPDTLFGCDFIRSDTHLMLKFTAKLLLVATDFMLKLRELHND